MQLSNRIAELRASDYTSSFRMMVASPIVLHRIELLLLQHTIEEISKEFPFFASREFLDRARNQDVSSIEACGNASLWACVNAAIALSMHAKIINSCFQQLSLSIWAYFKNAYATFPELILYGNDLKIVQALVFMALFVQSSADARTTSLLLSTALRLLQTLNLTLIRIGDGGERSAVESDYERRTLWTAFILDAELSLCCGLSPVLSAGDIRIDLPYEGSHVGHNEASSARNESHEIYGRIFRWRAELALICLVVRTRLYLRDVFSMPDNELLSTIVALD